MVCEDAYDMFGKEFEPESTVNQENININLDVPRKLDFTNIPTNKQPKKERTLWQKTGAGDPGFMSSQTSPVPTSIQLGSGMTSVMGKFAEMQHLNKMLELTPDVEYQLFTKSTFKNGNRKNPMNFHKPNESILSTE